MKSWKSIGLGSGLILAIAACGGDAAPPPAGGNGDGGQPGNGGEPVGTPMRTVIVNQDSGDQLYPLEGGRYRLAWTATDCPDGIEMVITQRDNLPGFQPAATPYEYRKDTNIPSFNTLLQRVPAGLYSVEQSVESCEAWEMRADRVGN